MSLADCDWIIEAIIEQPAPKRAAVRAARTRHQRQRDRRDEHVGDPDAHLIEARTEPFRAGFSACTSSIRRAICTCSRSSRPTDTAPGGARRGAAVQRDRMLGKGIVVAKDVPGFVANRLGVYGMVRAMQLHGGARPHDRRGGRAHRPAARPVEVGDVPHRRHLRASTCSPTSRRDCQRDDRRGFLAAATGCAKLVAEKRLGEKTGAGFYKRVGQGDHTLDWKTRRVRPAAEADDPSARRSCKLPLAERLAALTQRAGKYGEFVRKYCCACRTTC